MNKEVRQLVKRLRRSGWTQTHLNNNHIRMTHPLGEYTILPSTPSDARWILNKEAEIRAINKRAEEAALLLPPPTTASNNDNINHQPDEDNVIYFTPEHTTLIQRYKPFM